MRLAVLTASVLLTGCSLWWQDDPVVVPPRPNPNGLTQAEQELDAANDARLSKIAASVRVADKSLTDLSSPELKVVKSELGVTKLLAGEPTPEDLKEAEARVEAELDGREGTYTDALREVAKLNAVIKEADKKYEAEKAKKVAEYNAKLAEKELELKAKADELALANEQRINDRFIYGGVVAFALGFILLVSAPLPILKKVGASLSLVGGVLFSIPYLSKEPWFKTAIGAMLGVIMLGILAYAVAGMLKKKNEPDAPDLPK